MSLPNQTILNNPGDVSSLGSLPLQRRTVKACDQCRRRKTKCDAAIDRPCDACVKAGLPCSYGERVRQERGSAYVTYLEDRVAKLERLLFSTSLSPPEEQPQTGQGSQDSTLSSSRHSSQPSPSTLERLESLISHRGNAWRGHYSSLSGLGVLRCIHELNCQRIVSNTGGVSEQFLDLASIMDCALPSYVLFGSERDHLPPKQEINKYVNIAFSDCPWMAQLVDRTMIDDDLARIFNAQTFGKAVDDRDHLALVYAVLALGQRFDRDAPLPQRSVNNELFPQGYRAFTAARAIVELGAFDRNVITLTTGALMGLYLETCFAQSTAHLYLSNAAAAALRMGLHEQTPVASLFGTDVETRRRLFRALKVLDTYSASALGLPCTIRITDMDLALPTNMMTSPFMSHVRLLAILNETTEAAAKESSASIDRLQNVAAKLDAWSSQETMLEQAVSNDPTDEQYGEFVHLRLSAAYVKMLVYSPFVHHITRFTAGQSYHATVSAMQCLDAAVLTVQFIEMLELRDRWHEAHPVVNQSLIFATTILLHIELYSYSGTARHKSRPSCPKAMGLLERLAARSSLAADCMACLRPIWQAVEAQELNAGSGVSSGLVESMAALQQGPSHESRGAMPSSPVSVSGTFTAVGASSWFPQTSTSSQAASTPMTSGMAGMSTTDPAETWWNMAEWTSSGAGSSITQYPQLQPNPQQGPQFDWSNHYSSPQGSSM